MLTFNEVVDLCQSLFLDGGFDPPQPTQQLQEHIPEEEEGEEEGATFLTSVGGLGEDSQVKPAGGPVRGSVRGVVSAHQGGLAKWGQGAEAPLQQFWEWLEESELAEGQPFRHVTAASRGALLPDTLGGIRDIGLVANAIGSHRCCLLAII